MNMFGGLNASLGLNNLASDFKGFVTAITDELNLESFQPSANQDESPSAPQCMSLCSISDILPFDSAIYPNHRSITEMNPLISYRG